MKLKSEGPSYLDTVLKYYEEEIMGEVYFNGLVKHFPDAHEKEKLALLARVERCAAEAVRPLLEKYKLTPRSDSELKPYGEKWVERRGDLDWMGLMTEMSVRYPGYVDQFKALEAMAPPDDLEALEKMTDHEVVVIEFANREIAGKPNTLEPIHQYLTQA